MAATEVKYYTNNISTIIKDTLLNQYFQKWSPDLHRKAKTMHSSKQNKRFENYLKILPKNLGLKRSEFRTSNRNRLLEK